MITKRFFIPALIALGFASNTALAHPGHPIFREGVAHALSSPYHLAVLLIVSATCIGASRLVKSILWRRSLTVLGGVVAAGAVCVLLLQ